MARVLVLALLLALAGCTPVIGLGGADPAAVAATKWAADTDATWAELQRALVGHWKATTPDGRGFALTYRLVSNGTALVETFASSASGKETLSVYHRDGSTMMLTHYCAQGNQARLKAVVATRERVVFGFLDATNVAAEQDVIQQLTVALRPDGFDQETVYKLPSGALQTTTLHFFRDAPPP
jgi:hypothetical protein